MILRGKSRYCQSISLSIGCDNAGGYHYICSSYVEEGGIGATATTSAAPFMRLGKRNYCLSFEGMASDLKIIRVIIAKLPI